MAQAPKVLTRKKVCNNFMDVKVEPKIIML